MLSFFWMKPVNTVYFQYDVEFTLMIGLTHIFSISTFPDIFLEKRSSKGSLERNAMVSVMLRLVEYFSGVLFLTSNRVESLDPAFKTRITLGKSCRKCFWCHSVMNDLIGVVTHIGKSFGFIFCSFTLRTPQL